MDAAKQNSFARLRDRNPLALALALSLCIHLGLYGTWRLGQELGWWRNQPAWLTQIARKLAQSASAREQKPKPPQEKVIPMTFVEVDPETAVEEAPKDTKYYSTKNSRASNPDPKEGPTPKVDGRQDQVVRLMDNEKPHPMPLQPAPKPVEPPPKPPEPKAETETVGDLALARPRDQKQPGEKADPPKERPRTLAAARQKAMLSGEKIRQEGGVSSRGTVSIDAKVTPFGEYDRAFIAAVEQCWHLLIEEHQGTQRPGKVVVDFRLSYDGRITDVVIQENNSSEIQAMLCKMAIVKPSPYPRWPPAMRQVAGNSREVRFTFYYN